MTADAEAPRRRYQKFASMPEHGAEHMRGICAPRTPSGTAHDPFHGLYGYPHSAEEVRQMWERLVGFFKLLDRLDKKYNLGRAPAPETTRTGASPVQGSADSNAASAGTLPAEGKPTDGTAAPRGGLRRKPVDPPATGAYPSAERLRRASRGEESMATAPLGRIVPRRKSGPEPFVANGRPLGFCLFDFWRWSCSDLVSNATRGRLAEFVVATALGIEVRGIVRDEWPAFDLRTSAGLKVEVKSTAYLQSWHQERPSKIVFDVKKTRGWDAETNETQKEAGRHADVYVFALLAHQDKGTLDPLNLDQWRFYAVATTDLDARKRSQHSTTLESLKGMAGDGVRYAGLREAVERAAAGAPRKRV